MVVVDRLLEALAAHPGLRTHRREPAEGCPPGGDIGNRVLYVQGRHDPPDTHDYLRILVPPAEDRPPIPASAYNVAAQLLAVDAGVDGHPARARVHLSDGVWVTLRAARIGGPGQGEQQNIAVTIEESSPAERLDLFARAFGLSARETELLELLASGSDTKALAAQLFVSQHTVQDHLKSIFAKTATRTRPGLLSRALGT